MSRVHHTLPRQAPRVPERAIPRRSVMTATEAVGLATLAVAGGSLFSLFAAQLLGEERLGFAAAFGALGAIAAGVIGAVGVLALRRRPSVQRQALLEAASPIHPLLKRLMVEAPGTYMHSLGTANLSEAAAEAIGADSLVARVGAYYHDIGKLVQPAFFFENQENGESPHDASDPAESAEIIKAHVPDGVVLAEQYRMPMAVTDVIREHHGTSLVRYFYHKATESGVAVYEADFRYRGRPPRSKEAAIVMLADASEASVRAMSQPEVPSVEASVRRVIAERTEEGQLADSGLTSADLDTIAGVFVRQLMGFRHARCPYPAYRELEPEDVAQ